MVLSSEKSKFVNVQSFLLGYRGMMMTKISRGFSVKLAQTIFWYDRRQILIPDYFLF